jgi:hypothetical protein
MLDKWELLRSYIRGIHDVADINGVKATMDSVLAEMKHLEKEEEEERNRILGKP